MGGATEGNDFFYSERAGKVRALRNDGDDFCTLTGGNVFDFLDMTIMLEGDSARLGRFDATNGFDEGAFSGTVRTDDGMDFFIIKGMRNVVYDDLFFIGKGEVGEI